MITAILSISDISRFYESTSAFYASFDIVFSIAFPILICLFGFIPLEKSIMSIFSHAVAGRYENVELDTLVKYRKDWKYYSSMIWIGVSVLIGCIGASSPAIVTVGGSRAVLISLFAYSLSVRLAFYTTLLGIGTTSKTDIILGSIFKTKKSAYVAIIITMLIMMAVALTVYLTNIKITK